MAAEAQLAKIDFWKQLMHLEGMLSRGERAGIYELFNTVKDDLFAYLLRKDFDGFPHIKTALPDWPPEQIRQDSTGEFTLDECLKEALSFWQIVKGNFEAVTGKRVAASRIADYGAGWGRITRFCAKDVPPEALYAFEPNPVFCDLFERTRVEAQLVRTDWLSEGSLAIRDIDLTICFSIFTHASDRLARNIAERFKEITKPGSMIVLTIRPGAFLHASDGEMAHFSELERNEAIAAYERGHLVYKPYKDSPDWSVTVTPMSYLHSVFGTVFAISGPHMFFQNWTQIIVYLQRL